MYIFKLRPKRGGAYLAADRGDQDSALPQVGPDPGGGIVVR